MNWNGWNTTPAHKKIGEMGVISWYTSDVVINWSGFNS